jgi:hypothetical protein
MLESKFQARLIKDLKSLFPGCIVLKNDANYIQGIPDLLVLYNDRWAALEGKADGESFIQPNQKYYVDLMDSMSFARFINNENKMEILHELQLSFRTRRPTCLSKRI